MLPTSEDIKKELFKRSYFEYFKYFWEAVEPKEFIDSSHIKYLCEEVGTVLKWAANFDSQDDNSYDLLINVAPGSSKSLITSKIGASYLWAINPSTKIITSSYSTIPVKDFTDKFLQVINSEKFKSMYPEISLRLENVLEQKNTLKGERRGVSVMGSITGFHADLILVDDPHKPPNLKRLDDGTERLELGANTTDIFRANSWHDDVLTTRKSDKKHTRTIYVMQRLHKSDLSNYLKSKALKGGINLKHIVLPSELENNAYSETIINGEIVAHTDLSFLYTNNLLDPARSPKDILTKTKISMGSFVYEAQYQQNPSKMSAGIIPVKQISLINYQDSFNDLVTYFYTDPSEGKSTSDNMATIAFSVFENKLLVKEIMVNKVGFDKFVGFRDINGTYIKGVYDLFVEKWGNNWQSIHMFEAKSSGTPYMQYLAAHTGYNVQADNPRGSKAERAMLVNPLIESNRVLFCKGAWNSEALFEIENFTGQDGDADDRVDVLTAALRLTSLNGTVLKIEQSKSERVSLL